MMANTGKLRPKRAPFPGFEWVGISSVNAYERIKNLSFRPVKEPKMKQGLTDAFYGCERDENFLV